MSLFFPRPPGTAWVYVLSIGLQNKLLKVNKKPYGTLILQSRAVFCFLFLIFALGLLYL